MRSASLFSTMPGVEKKPVGGDKAGGGLHNTIYEQQTRSGRRLTIGRRLFYQSIVPVGLSLVHLVWRWSRVVSMVGARAHPAGAGAGPVLHSGVLAPASIVLCQTPAGATPRRREARIPHQSVGRRRTRRDVGAQAGGRRDSRLLVAHRCAGAARLLSSPIEDDVSPAITPDGPRGPPWKFKPGAVLLAQLSQRPIIPMAYAASRAWKIQMGQVRDPQTVRPHLHRRG